MAVEVLFDTDFDCRQCDEILKDERGCGKKGKIPFDVGEDRIFQCPKSLISPLSVKYLRAFAFYEKGILPNSNGWNKESKKYLDAMILIANTRAECELKKIKKPTS